MLRAAAGAAAFLLLLCAPTHAQAPVTQVSPNVRVFVGAEGLEVTIVRVMPLSRRQALVKIAGIDSDWNNRIFLCTLEESIGRADYYFSLDGIRYVLVAGLCQDGALSYGLYLKDVPDERSIRYSPARSRQVTSRALLGQYEKQGRR